MSYTDERDYEEEAFNRAEMESEREDEEEYYSMWADCASADEVSAYYESLIA